jgi:hypothetical protein
MAVPFVSSSATIQVEMEVGRYREFRDDGMVEVWGWVGDYEVAVCFPVDDPRMRSLKSKSRRTPRKAGPAGPP